LLALLKFHANSFMVTTVGVIPTTPFSLRCVCVFCGNNCFDCAAKEWRKISENLTKSYFICARQNSRATTPPKKKGPVEPRTFSKAGHRWRAGDCMWLDTLEEMCAKNY